MVPTCTIYMYVYLSLLPLLVVKLQLLQIATHAKRLRSLLEVCSQHAFTKCLDY